jgi:hypothetical protein
MSGLLLGIVLSVCTCWFHSRLTFPPWVVSTDFGTCSYQCFLSSCTLCPCICWNAVVHSLYNASLLLLLLFKATRKDSCPDDKSDRSWSSLLTLSKLSLRINRAIYQLAHMPSRRAEGHFNSLRKASEWQGDYAPQNAILLSAIGPTVGHLSQLTFGRKHKDILNSLRNIWER